MTVSNIASIFLCDQTILLGMGLQISPAGGPRLRINPAGLLGVFRISPKQPHASFDKQPSDGARIGRTEEANVPREQLQERTPFGPFRIALKRQEHPAKKLSIRSQSASPGKDCGRHFSA